MTEWCFERKKKILGGKDYFERDKEDEKEEEKEGKYKKRNQEHWSDRSVIDRS